jgi:AraC-like DNA-binding protein
MLRTALEPHFHAACCRTEYELWDELARVDAKVLLLELGQGGRPSAAGLIAAVRHRYPAMRIVGYAWLTQAIAAEIVACAKCGLDALALRGFCDLGAVVRRVLAESQGAEEVALADIMDWLTPTLIAAARALLQRLDDVPSLSQLARLIGVSQRSLQREAARGKCCSPGGLMCAIRVLVAVRLSAVERLPIERVVKRTGYPSARALGNAMKRCGLASPRRLHGTAGYAAARDIVLRFISASYARDVSPATWLHKDVSPAADMSGMAPVPDVHGASRAQRERRCS